MVDDQVPTAAQMFVTLGALSGGSRLNVDSGESFSGSNRAGFTISSDSELLDLTVLDQVTVSLLNNGTVVDTTGSGGLLGLQLLTLGGFDQQFLFVETAETFDALRIDLSATVGLLSDLNVHQSCVGPTP